MYPPDYDCRHALASYVCEHGGGGGGVATLVRAYMVSSEGGGQAGSRCSFVRSFIRNNTGSQRFRSYRQVPNSTPNPKLP